MKHHKRFGDLAVLPPSGFCWQFSVFIYKNPVQCLYKEMHKSSFIFLHAPFLKSTSFTVCIEQSPCNWLLPTVITASLITCIISFYHMQNSRIHQRTHQSAQRLLAAFTHIAMLQTPGTQPLCMQKLIFSPWVVSFSSFYMTLSEALLYKTDSYCAQGFTTNPLFLL